MYRNSSISYETSGLFETFIVVYNDILKDVKAFTYKHIYLLGYF